jgi:Putative Ig domain
VAVGPKVHKGYSSTKFYQHQSTLRLSLEALGLTRWPNAAAQAPSMAEFFTSAGGAGSAPSITSALSATASVGSPFRYQITASNNPTSYGATGLPPGLTLNATTGLTSGTPSANGSYSVTQSQQQQRHGKRHFGFNRRSRRLVVQPDIEK